MDGKYELENWEEGRKQNEPDVPFWASTRLCLAAIGFIGFLHIYAQRVGMSVAIVCMVNQTAVKMMRDHTEMSTNGVYLNISGPAVPYNTTSSLYVNATNPPSLDMDVTDLDKCSDEYLASTGGRSYDMSETDGPFVWDKSIQGHVLGSFFYGYLVSQVPAGMLAESYSGKWVFFIFISISTVATLLTPIAAKVSWIALVVVRVIAGIGSGCCYPCMHVIWSRWAPPNERTKLTSLTYAGAWMGNVVALPLSGILCSYGFDGGWPSIFYVIGGSSALWLVIWVLFVSDSPQTSKRIKPAERDYILDSLKGQGTGQAGGRKEGVPWKSILTSPQVLAVTVAGITSDWGLYTYLTNIPTYMSEVLKFDVQSNGFFSALPFLGLYINMNISPFIADKLITSGTLSTTSVRKIMMSVGSLGAAVFMIALGFMDCTTPMLAVTLLAFGVTISASVYSGYLINPMDIAPKYAGTVLGVANGIGAITGFAAPYTVAALTPNQTQEEWQKVFYISAAIYVFGTIVFCLLASAEIQPWAAEGAESNEKSAPKAEELETLKAEETC